jgi:hypothetical protein
MAKGDTHYCGLVCGAHVKKFYCIPSRLNYCVTYIICTQLTNVAPGHIVQPGGPQIGDL